MQNMGQCQENLEELAQLMEQGQVTPAVGKTFTSLHDIPKAMGAIGAGKTVVSIAPAPVAQKKDL